MKSGKATIPAILVILSALLAFQPDLRLAVPMLIGCTALMTLTLAFAIYLGKMGILSWSPTQILTVALVLRLMFIFAPPQLSDDIYRYLWDGGNLLRDVDPYVSAPVQVTPPPDMKLIHSRINHPEYVTIYPPAAQFIFASGASLGGGVIGLKALLVFLDMLLCILIMAMLQRMELPVTRAVLYAWNPLPMLEIAGSGHVDGAGMTLLMAAIFFLLAGRHRSPERPSRTIPIILSGALLAFAGLVKVYPLILAPLLLLAVSRSRRLHFLAAFLGVTALLLLPFLPHLSNLATTLNVYARNWEYSSLAFNLLRGMTGSGTAARIILAISLCAVIAVVAFRAFNQSRQQNVPKGVELDVMTGCYTAAMTFLLLTPTLHPWYALFLAAFLPFAPGPAGLVLCWAVFLTYRVQIGYFILGEWNESAYVTAVVALAPVAAFLLSWLFKVMAREKILETDNTF